MNGDFVTRDEGPFFPQPDRNERQSSLWKFRSLWGHNIKGGF